MQQTQSFPEPAFDQAETPNLAELWRQAAKSFETSDYEVAEALCERLIALAPEKPMAYSLMSRLHHRKGQVRPATYRAFQASQRVAGSHWKDIISISAALLEVGESQLAHGVLSFINPHDPINRECLLELGRQYSTLEDQPRALHCIELARSFGGNGFFSSHMLGIVLSFTGPIDRAVAACEESVVQKPTYGHAHWSRAQFGQKEGAEQRVARMREALQSPGLSEDDKAFLYYGVFKELDTVDRPDEAWPALMAGARARRGVSQHCAEKENRAFDALIKVTSGKFLDKCVHLPNQPTPIFVVGMPRTGTTLLERILGNHPQIATCGELNDFRQQMQWVSNVRLPAQLDGNFGNFVAHLNYGILGRRYMEKTRWRTEGKTYFSDKHPMNFMLCGLILKAIPHARIIHLRRHPMDSCFSNLKELFAKGYYLYSYTLEELANHYRNYDRLMRHWHRIAPDRILDVNYEDLAAQPEQQARRVQDYLGIAKVDGVSDILANKKVTTTASTLQLRQPIHTRNVGGWRRYQDGLSPLRSLLAEFVDAYEAPGKATLFNRL